MGKPLTLTGLLIERAGQEQNKGRAEVAGEDRPKGKAIKIYL